MVGRSKRADRKIETQLRAARPEPDAKLAQAVADRVRPRRSLMGSLARVPLLPVGGLTAIVVAVAVTLAASAPQLDFGTPASHQYGHPASTLTVTLTAPVGGVCAVFIEGSGLQPGSRVVQHIVGAGFFNRGAAAIDGTFSGQGLSVEVGEETYATGTTAEGGVISNMVICSAPA